MCTMDRRRAGSTPFPTVEFDVSNIEAMLDVRVFVVFFLSKFYRCHRVQYQVHMKPEEHGQGYEEEQTKQECHEHWQIFEKKIRLVCHWAEGILKSSECRSHQKPGGQDCIQKKE